MTKEQSLLIAQTKLEVYREVEKKIEEILEDSTDVLFDYENEIFLKIQKLEDEISLIECDKVDFVKNFILSLETWEPLDESSSAIIKSIIENENIESKYISNSLHVSESRYEIDGDTFRLIGAIGGSRDTDDVEKLIQ
jgi:hypothetical protein